MPVRNGLLSTLRARGRTALFTLLILVLTVALALGLGMWAYCGELLAQMDQEYISVALVEYMGEDYPDVNAADDSARAALEQLDGDAMRAVDGVKLWEPAQSTLVSIDGYKNPSRDSPYRTNAVVVATITPEYGTGRAIVDEADLPESRAVRHSIPGDINDPDDVVEVPGFGMTVNNYTYYTFYLPGVEPLELPCYHYSTRPFSDSEEEVYLWGGWDGSAEEPEGTYVLWHSISDSWGNRWGIYSIVGELPEEYDQYARDFMNQYDPFSRAVIEDLLKGAPEWPVYEYYEEPNVYYGNNEKILNKSYGRIRWSLYTGDPYTTLCYFSMGDTGLIPEQGKSYLLNGAFVSNSSGRAFEIQPFPHDSDDPWLELSGDDDPALTDSIFTRYAALYQASNNTAILTASDDIAALEVFQQGTLHLEEGRFPQAGERGVCVISGSMAEYLQLGAGDTLELEILESDPEVRANISTTGDRRALEIVGVTNLQFDYADRLWVSAAEGSGTSPLFGYSLGMAVLDNRKAAQAAEELSALLPALVQLTLYDQGYAGAARPIQAMETAAQAITLAAACGALAVLVLFAFLFVGRQRETVGVLVSLGTPVGKIRVWLLSGAAAIAGTAALLGAVIGSLTLGRVTAAAMEMAEQLYTADNRYSEAAQGLIRESSGAGELPGWPAPAAGAAVFLAALALCLVFLHHARKENAPKQGKVSVRVPRGTTSTGGRGAMRFAALSARRGGRRSVVVVAAALVLTLFVSLLAASTQSWSGQMASLYEDSRLQGQIVSLNGRMQTGLDIPIRNIQALWKSEHLGDIAASLSWHYDRNAGSAMPSIYHVSGRGNIQQETKDNYIAQQPTVSAVNSLSAAGEFYYTDRPEVRYLDGWDESFLADSSHPSVLEGIYACMYEGAFLSPDYVYPVLVGSRFLENSGLSLGDTLSVTLYMEVYTDWDYRVEWPVQLQIVGSFTSTGVKDNFYVPLSLWCAPEWLRGEGDRDLSKREFGSFQDAAGMARWIYYNTSFDSCRFTLKTAYELEDLRNWLAEEGYSAVGVTNRNRTTIILRDENFTETVGGLNRYISFSRILFPVLFAVVGLMGFIISWLTVSSRRMEFAVMRGLGASPGRAFASFFLEQTALCLLGCLIGVLAMVWKSSSVLLAGAVFLACYLAGCALSVLAAGRTNLMLLLSERE